MPAAAVVAREFGLVCRTTGQLGTRAAIISCCVGTRNGHLARFSEPSLQRSGRGPLEAKGAEESASGNHPGVHLLIVGLWRVVWSGSVRSRPWRDFFDFAS